MNLDSFHHPDICLPVLRSRAADFLVDMLDFYGEAICTRGKSATWCSCFPSNTAYRSAIHRLRRKGVVASHRRKDGSSVLRLAVTRKTTNPALRPERRWNARWDGIWRVMVYDISEKERCFRNSLRSFLSSLRMGCLQKSVWVTPQDIRPEYADLQTTLGIEHVSHLFEARTVLGRSAQTIVSQAWDFGALTERQRWFIATARSARDRLQNSLDSHKHAATMAKREWAAFLSVMQKDPLLPRKLHPREYLGLAAYEQHMEFVAAARQILR